MINKEIGRWEDVRFEKMHTEIFPNSAIASIAAAEEIAAVIREKNATGQTAVLGLIAGTTPVRVYAELVRIHKEDGLSFSNVVVFNLNDYYDLDAKSPRSYSYFMHQHLFSKIDILPENINMPDSSIPTDRIDQWCADYDMKIKSYGGLDILLLGIGRTGHIGFNESGSHINSGTRLINLDHSTRSDVSTTFHGIENAPKRGITMGIGTILKARRIILMAWGNEKAEILKQAIEAEISSDNPSSYLQSHKNCTVLLDVPAAEQLTRVNTPWVVGPCIWDEAMQRKAIIWLSSKVGKSLLKLTDRDYNDNFMSSLLAQEDSAYKLNIKMFNVLQHTITGWPGGKPNADDSARPERAEPANKRVLIFSPHPDDAIISMGGTIRRLVEQGHEVHLAIQTSGSISVSDSEARRFVEFSEEFFEYQSGEPAPKDIYINIKNSLAKKSEDQTDPKAIRKAKALIRRTETLASTRFMGIDDKNVHFLDLPFYETGLSTKAPISKKDNEKMSKILNTVKPHQIFAAGDLDDPHGTQKTCLDIIYSALARAKSENFIKDCWLWLYRGAWAEWPIEEIEMAVPISPDEFELKKKAIFFHGSQKNNVMYLGDDKREFWQRAEDRNKHTARSYHRLGLADYEAMEAFSRYKFK